MKIRSKPTNKKNQHGNGQCCQNKTALFSGISTVKDETSLKQFPSAILKFYQALQIENHFFLKFKCPEGQNRR